MESDHTIETVGSNQVEVEQLVRALGLALKATPELRAYMAAARAVDADGTVQDLLKQIQAHQIALQWGQSDRAGHLSALAQLQAGLAAQPAVQAYYRTERAVRELFRTVDEVVSAAAGVDFAANARRSCCGG